jgi:hypothetical protein
MPGRNGTGPMGQGAMTGRGLGYCTGNNTAVYGRGAGCGFGRGFGRGMGLGYGFRRGFGNFYAGQLPDMADKEILTEQKELLQRSIDAINKQLDSKSKSE